MHAEPFRADEARPVIQADDGVPHRPRREVRLIGVGCVVIGVLWIVRFFGKRGGDLGLI